MRRDKKNRQKMKIFENDKNLKEGPKGDQDDNDDSNLSQISEASVFRRERNTEAEM
jgi:hypothetical protein